MEENTLGSHLRAAREALESAHKGEYSLRAVAGRLAIEPSYLSKLERGETTAISEEKLFLLAQQLNQDPNVLLALAGKVSKKLRAIICKHPKAFAELLEQLENEPEHAILRVVREVRTGNW
jgi:transcriptional regulator with XRE-family HTH domain